MITWTMGMIMMMTMILLNNPNPVVPTLVLIIISILNPAYMPKIILMLINQ